MPDRMTPKQRHDCMSHIRSRNTKPEVLLRKELHRLGYRYRINVRKLPGTPDIVLAKYRTCIFVNGCFWHGHKGCSKFVMPKTNEGFWADKIRNNHERDLKNAAMLEATDWKVITVWECQLKKGEFSSTVESIRKQLDDNRTYYAAYMADRLRRREEWRLEMKRRKQEENMFCEQHLHTTTNDN